MIVITLLPTSTYALSNIGIHPCIVTSCSWSF